MLLGPGTAHLLGKGCQTHLDGEALHLAPDSWLLLHHTQIHSIFISKHRHKKKAPFSLTWLGGQKGWRLASSGHVMGIISVVALSFMVQLPSGIMEWARLRSRFSRRFRYRSISCSLSGGKGGQRQTGRQVFMQKVERTQ